ncbi:MAG: isochorismatase family cysteine hydrolase [Gammaproteobacteria bacterium]
MDKSHLGPTASNSYVVGAESVDMTRAHVPVRRAELKAQPQSIAIDLNRTAVVVVDMQNDFCAPGGWFDSLGVPVAAIHPIYPRIKAVTDSARALNVPVIWLGFGTRPDRANLAPITRYPFARVGGGVGLGDSITGRGRSEPHNILEKGSWGAEVVPELGARPTDIHVDKHRISGFWDTPLDSILRQHDIKTVAFLGVNSDECVFATLIDGSFHGYDTIMIEDGCATSSPASCHEAALYQVRFCFGFTVTSQDWTSALKSV